MKSICEKLAELIPPEVNPVFIGEIPSQSDEGVALAPTDLETRYWFLGQEESIVTPYIQCSIRTKEYLKGENFSDILLKVLNGTIEDENLLGIRPITYTNYLGKNEDKLHEFQLTFKVILKE